MYYDVATIVWTIGLILAIAGLMVLAVTLRRWVRRGRNVGTLPPELAREGSVQPQLLATQRALLGKELLRDGKALPDHEREVVYHALWHAMLLESVCDGSIDRREIELVSDTFGRLSGHKLAAGTATEAAERIAADPDAALREVAKARTMSRASREHVLQGAFLVSTADGEVIASEANRLGDIADALGIAMEERQRIYSELARRLENKAG